MVAVLLVKVTLIKSELQFSGILGPILYPRTSARNSIFLVAFNKESRKVTIDPVLIDYKINMTLLKPILNVATFTERISVFVSDFCYAVNN